MKAAKYLRPAVVGLASILLLVFSVTLYTRRSAAQIQLSGAIWQAVDESRLPAAPAGTRVIVPRRYRTVALNTAALRAVLAAAPLEFSAQAAGGRVTVSLPTPDGRL